MNSVQDTLKLIELGNKLRYVWIGNNPRSADSSSRFKSVGVSLGTRNFSPIVSENEFVLSLS